MRTNIIGFTSYLGVFLIAKNKLSLVSRLLTSVTHGLSYCLIEMLGIY